MGQFVKGDVVVLNFPFSDLSQTKRRPALVVATLKGDDVMLFTADAGIIVYRVGRVSEAKLNEVVDRLIVIIKQA